ncbi:baseplate assembly protein [Mergibacter septicus]|uniref:Baseplate assembly protein n=1 Tax=Mergibacter septicus TaxID=221402 RepID=A0A8D4J088_9PAST|nr:baseplate J/gp47 family protein [Mergibacter septicus]AWX15597.1 baseplate assembly protein [Mergibacter septicus]QDJ13076.1 baseplate assembly protein [Mergibacter septicus]QDJ14851.1 baseplate assembly protein [Mergibacter septicus]UTU47721.1 baseplate J/gp47 family protein [Mergibacter septicus]WMR96672.1 baseplate J/gp47 family protein [Mergibacter septicus]
MSALIDLSKIPQPDFIEPLSFEAIFNARKIAFIRLYPEEEQSTWQQRLSLESEPIVKLLQENAYRELILRQQINNRALAVSLAHAKGADLDNIAGNYNVKRLVIQNGDQTANPPLPEILESDEALRYRTQLAFDSISTAGAKSSYEYHTLSADGRVADVNVISPSPCHVTVTILSHLNNGQANSELLDKVRNALNDENVRPVADRVTVQSAEIHQYQITATIYTYKAPEAEPIKNLAERRLSEFVNRKLRLGKDINISAIHAALHVEGVQRVEVTEPSQNIVLTGQQAGFCSQINLTVRESDD